MVAHSNDDFERLRTAQQGDAAAMEAVYRAQAPRLAARLRRLTGDASAAADLLQDTFVTAFTGSAFRGDSSVATWLYGIARHHLLNRRRKRSRRSKALAAGQATQPLQLADTEELALLRDLDAALQGLRTELREAFVLRTIERLPVEQAAALAGVSVSTISKRAAKAERAIRRAFETQKGPQDNG